MLDIIAATLPRTVAALRRAYGINRRDAASLIMAARFGDRSAIWTAEDCDKARNTIARAFLARNRRLRLQREG